MSSDLRPFAGPNFQTVFEAAPGARLLLGPDLSVAAASDAYVHAARAGRADFIGRRFADVLAAGAPETATLLRSAQRVLDTGSADAVTVPLRALPWFNVTQGIGTCHVTHAPIAGRDGRVAFVLHQVDAVSPAAVDESSHRAVAENEERLSLATSLNHLGTWDWNMLTNEVDWDRTCEAIFGFIPGTFNGDLEAYNRIIHPDDRERIWAASRAALERHEDATNVYRVIWPDGSVHWVSSVGRALLDGAGRAYRMLGIVMDVTDRKAAEQEMQHLLQAETEARALAEAEHRRLDEALGHLENILTAAPAGIGYIDRALRYVRLNDALAEMIGVSVADALGRRLDEVLPELAGVITPVFERILATGEAFVNQEVEGETPQAPGKMRYWLVSYYPVFSPTAPTEPPLGVGVIVVDITERRQIQARLEQAVRARDEFLSICSHELKTPITALKLQLQAAQRRYKKGDSAAFAPQKVAQLLESTDRQIARLERLVEDMLDISRISTGKLTMHKERVELCALVREAIERIAPHCEVSGSRICLTLGGDLFGDWDRYRIEQVILNLLLNAVRYGRGQPIDVRAYGENQRVKLVVRDAGIGIAPENHGRVFQKFERVVSANNIAGLGLGLYIVRNILAQHDGSIDLDSTLGGGATFTVDLPMAETSKATHDTSTD